jgi:hypothetical protein
MSEIGAKMGFLARSSAKATRWQKNGGRSARFRAKWTVVRLKKTHQNKIPNREETPWISP